MAMKVPPHPGLLVREVMDEAELTVGAAADKLGVSRSALTRFLGGGGLSPEMALRLEAVFGATAETWLRMQANHDAAEARRVFGHIAAGLERLTPDAA